MTASASFCALLRRPLATSAQADDGGGQVGRDRREGVRELRPDGALDHGQREGGREGQEGRSADPGLRTERRGPARPPPQALGRTEHGD